MKRKNDLTVTLKGGRVFRTRAAVARELGVHTSTVWSWTAVGLVETHKVRNTLLVSVDDATAISNLTTEQLKMLHDAGAYLKTEKERAACKAWTDLVAQETRAQATRSHQVWEVTEIERALAEGVPLREIAINLGRSYGAVIHRRHVEHAAQEEAESEHLAVAR